MLECSEDSRIGKCNKQAQIQAHQAQTKQEAWDDVVDLALNLGQIGLDITQCCEMFERGEGTNQDMTKARFWYKKAADQGSQEASEALENLKM